MTKFQLVLSLLGVLSLSSCNLWGGIDTPSGDDQILSAARGCFDRADYTCATKYYGQLSSAQSDTRIAETALVSMAQDGIFSIADVVRSLGNGRGDANSFSKIANYIAARGKTSASYRIQLDRLFVEAGSIVNANSRAYTRFLIGLAMTNQILAAITNSDANLDAADISSTPNACRASSGSCADPGVFPDNSAGGDPGTWNGITTDSAWGNGVSVNMLITAAAATQTNLTALGGSSGDGITQVLGQLAGVSGLAAIKRQTLLTILFP
ncbi:MAG: hypothetical protein JST80_04320 [Bdellovibrionales bacterium]|nr:hypothetical protein [Bdellovibrionales bacterium]